MATKTTATKKPFDFWIFITILILLSMGIVMLFSASAPAAYTYKNDIYHFLKDQLLFAFVGFIAMFVAMNFHYKKLAKLAPILLVICMVLLILVLVPSIGYEANNARRWLRIGRFTVQPSEMAKLALILFLSSSLSRRKDQLQYFFRGLLPYLVVIGMVAGLIVVEPHLSATIIILIVSSIILFCAGAKIRHFVIMAVPAVAGLGIVVAMNEYMQKRLFSFINPWSDLKGDGWQAVQSLYAIGSGGLFGRGLGKSLQKFLYIPEPYNDFIFSILAEELGFIGVVTVMLLFLVLVWRGVKVAMNAPDTFGCLVAVGITSLITVQVLLNIAVVTSSIPPTGVSLPFFSSGGTSLLFFMTEIGILLNISKYSKYERI